MPRPRVIVPRYCRHKTTNRAYVRLGGQFHYLGQYGTPTSREKYAQIVRRCQAEGGPSTTPSARPVEQSAVTVAGVLAAFWSHAKGRYDYDPSYDGRRPPGEIGCYHDAMRPVLKLYGSTPAVEFGPEALELVQAEMMAMGWCRNVVNRATVRVRTMFKHAVKRKLIPGEVLYQLKTVEAIRRNHKGVRNTPRVLPVPAAVINATLAVMPARHAAMVRLQLLTGMRSTNLCQMRTADVDTSGGADGKGAWVYRPRKHKTEHHDVELAIRLGPKARAVLGPFLNSAVPEAFLFSPAQHMAEVRAERTANRKTPLSSGNRPGSKPAKRVPGRSPGDHYTRDSYGGLITRACDLADLAARRAAAVAKGDDPAAVPEQVPAADRLVPRWNPHRLRHNKGTAVRARHGTDGVLATLGQRTSAMADRYAEIEADKAERIAAELG